MTVKHIAVKDSKRAKWMRIDTAKILKRLFFCERALITSQAGWLAGIAPFEIKNRLPKFLWEDAMTANVLRERVLELHYPRRLMEIGTDKPLVDVFEEAINAPGSEAFVLSLARIFKPAMLAVYNDYIKMADPLSEGPILRALRLAIEEKAVQIAELTRFAEHMLMKNPGIRAQAEAWVSSLSERLGQVGAVSFTQPIVAEHPLALKGRKDFQLSEVPARDEAFHLCHYYWPDIIDETHEYVEGLHLQIRSAISHFNEVWAVETAGAILQAFADELEWEFIYDVARWTYDESRHVSMGFERLQSWGFEKEELPLGSYIFDSARGQDPLVRLAMLHYFESKNIGKKTKRIKSFAEYGDRSSQHDMDFDWADETIHAHYGKHWMQVLRELNPQREAEFDTILAKCQQLVDDEVASASKAELQDIRQVAAAIIKKAESF